MIILDIYLNFFTRNFYICPCSVMVALPTCNRAVAGSTPVTGKFESVLLLK